MRTAVKMKGFFSLLLLACFCQYCLAKAPEQSIEEILFDSFVSNYSKSYKNDPDTMSMRFKVFQQSLARQKLLNDYERDHGGTAVYGVNQFSDLTPDEFKEMHLSPKKTLAQSNNLTKVKDLKSDRFDWRDQNVIGRVRNQGQCGSCWAFAVVETIESAFAIERRQNLQYILSSQQLISCAKDPNLGLYGCKGGVIGSAFKSLENTELVLVEESVYPFQSSDGGDYPCQKNLPPKGEILVNFTYVDHASLDEMTKLLYISPLTTSINAVTWQDYVGGIIQHHCTNEYVDHAVQVVGYDLTGEVPYWIVRNTWGENWGEKGYIRILHGTNMCGIRDEVVAVKVVKGMNL